MNNPILERSAFNLDAFMDESNRIEGMGPASPEEVAATARFLSRKNLTISDLVDLVAVYQPNARPRFVQGLDVRVGRYIAPRGGPYVQSALDLLLQAVNTRDIYSPHQSHILYEKLHPFTDGNGRSGRAVWLWAMGGIEEAPLGFLHHFYYQTLQNS